MDSLQEVSSTMTEDAEVATDIQASQPQNGISLAEAANALITLQVPAKDSTHPAAIPVSTSKNGESPASNMKLETEDVSSKDFRKRILEGMKSQFNTNSEEQVDEGTCEPSSRRIPPPRSKSKPKKQEGDNEEEASEIPSKVESPSRSSRGRGRPPRGTQPEKPKLLLNVPKKEVELGRPERDSSSEAGSERSDSASGSASTPTTRRSQRTNISRTSATDLLKGLASEIRPSATCKKTPSTEPEMPKPTDLPRKRGRPAKVVAAPAAGNQTSESGHEPPVEDDVSKMEHMASLGLLSKGSPELSMQNYAF